MNAMTLQDILAMQAARQRAYEADLDDMVRYGKGALFTSTVIVDLCKMFDQKGENLLGLRLEIPTEVTLGQLVQLLGEVTQEQFSDAFFLEQLQPYFSGIVADEWQEASQTLEYFTSSQCSDLLLRPEGTALDDHGWPLLADGCIGYVSLPMMYPEKENLLVLDVPAHVSLNDASAFLLSSGITVNQAFPADINKFL